MCQQTGTTLREKKWTATGKGKTEGRENLELHSRSRQGVRTRHRARKQVKVSTK